VQVRIGLRAGSLKEHVVDFVAERGGKAVLISTKWQNSRGSAEEKVPWEVLCLNHALRETKYRAAFLVLGGKGWSLRDYFTALPGRDLSQEPARPLVREIVHLSHRHARRPARKVRADLLGKAEGYRAAALSHQHVSREPSHSGIVVQASHFEALSGPSK